LLHVLRLSVVAVVFLGAVAPGATAIFFFSDPLMGILALVNLLALIMLFPTATRLIRDYRKKLKQGADEPVFNPDEFMDLDIDRTAWTKK
jgi:AGCS family alanine or glycine:cation symporter